MHDAFVVGSVDGSAEDGPMIQSKAAHSNAFYTMAS